MSASGATADGSSRALSGRHAGWLLAGPAILFMLIFCAYPLLRLFLASLDGGGGPLGNYARLFTSAVYLTVVKRTFAISGGVTAICLLIAYPTAYALTQLISPAWQRRLIILVVVPYLTSQLARIYAWKVLLGDNGTVNATLAWLGLSEGPVPLLYNTTGMIIGMTHIMLPLMIMPLYATMRGIDRSLTRAATAMGAGPIRAFVSVFLPLSLSGVRSGCVLVFVATLGAYIIPSGLGGLGDSMVSNLIQAQVEGSLNFGLAGAAAFLLLGMTLVVFAVVGGDLATVYRTGEARKPGGAARRSLPWMRRGAAARPQALTAPLNAFLWKRRLAGARRSSGAGRILLIGFAAAVLAFLAAPSLIVVIISFSADSFLSFPPSGYSLRWYESYLQSAQWRSATALSFLLAPLSAALSLLLGLSAAYALVRGALPLRRSVLALLLAPMIIPSVVSGIAIFGTLAEWRLIGTHPGILVAHTTGGVAFVVIIGMSALAGLDRRLELAAMSLGARPLTMFRRVIAPLIMPGIVAGGLFAFIHSFDEVIVTSFVSGTRLQTLPVKMWNDMVLEVDPTTAAVSALLVALPLLWLLVMEGAALRRARTRDTAG